MKKKITTLIAVLFSLALMCSMVACSSQKLSADYNEDEVIARAKEVVDTAFTLDFAATVDLLREDLKSQLSVDDLSKSWGEILAKVGKFEDYKKVATAGQKSESTEEEYAVAVVICDCENGTATFTISMDKDLEIVGMYLK